MALKRKAKARHPTANEGDILPLEIIHQVGVELASTRSFETLANLSLASRRYDEDLLPVLYHTLYFETPRSYNVLLDAPLVLSVGSGIPMTRSASKKSGLTIDGGDRQKEFVLRALRAKRRFAMVKYIRSHMPMNLEKEEGKGYAGVNDKLRRIFSKSPALNLFPEVQNIVFKQQEFLSIWPLRFVISYLAPATVCFQYSPLAIPSLDHCTHDYICLVIRSLFRHCSPGYSKLLRISQHGVVGDYVEVDHGLATSRRVIHFDKGTAGTSRTPNAATCVISALTDFRPGEESNSDGDTVIYGPIEFYGAVEGPEPTILGSELDFAARERAFRSQVRSELFNRAPPLYELPSEEIVDRIMDRVVFHPLSKAGDFCKDCGCDLQS